MKRQLVLTAAVYRNDLKSVLARSSATLGVGLLLESIAQTADFEREMSRKFSLRVSPDCLLSASVSYRVLTETLKQQFEEILKLSQISYGVVEADQAISSVFEPYLGIFVDAQDKCVFSCTLPFHLCWH